MFALWFCSGTFEDTYCGALGRFYCDVISTIFIPPSPNGRKSHRIECTRQSVPDFVQFLGLCPPFDVCTTIAFGAIEDRSVPDLVTRRRW